VSHDDWIKARKNLLEKEKELSRHIDEVIAARQAMPWEVVNKDYEFDSVDGKVKLSQLFAVDKTELFVYHLMFDPEDDSACNTCQFFVDGFNGYYPHISSRCNIYVIAKAPISKLAALHKAKQWKLAVLSSHECTFNEDFCVERTAEEKAQKKPLVKYNYDNAGPWVVNQMPGLSIFVKRHGVTYHTYSAYARGLDIVNAGHSMLDMLPYGRDGFSPKYTGLRVEAAVTSVHPDISTNSTSTQSETTVNDNKKRKL